MSRGSATTLADPVTDGVVAFIPATRVLVVGGRDRRRFLHAILAQDVGGLAPGEGAYGALTDERGRPIADYQLAVLPEVVLLELPVGRADETRAALDRLIIADDVVTAWAAGETVAYEAGDAASLAAALAVARNGRLLPALEALADLAPGVAFVPGEDRPSEDEAALARVPMERQAVLRGSRLGGYGALHWSAGDGPAELARVVVGEPRVVVLAESRRAALEIEAGRMAAPELAEARVWNELAVMQAVSLTKGCWMGQESVRRVHSRGEIQRRLGGILVEAPDGEDLAGARLETPDGAPAGVVTRAARSGTLGRTVGLAFLHRAAWAAGTALVAVRGDGVRTPVLTCELPFVRRVPTGAGVPRFEPLETA